MDDFQVKMLKKLYPDLTDEDIKSALGIRASSKNILSHPDIDVSTWDDYFEGLDAGNIDPMFHDRYFKVAGKEGNKLLTLEGPSADTISYSIDPEVFKGIDEGDYIRGLSMFNVMYGGQPINMNSGLMGTTKEANTNKMSVPKVEDSMDAGGY